MNEDQISREPNNPLTDAKPGVTHILIDYPSQVATHLFRASDGMMLGMRDAMKVRWGVNPESAQARVFMNEACAMECLKAAAKEDLNGPVIVRSHSWEACEADIYGKPCGLPIDVHTGDGCHKFVGSKAVIEPVFEERNGESKIEIPSPHLLRRN